MTSPCRQANGCTRAGTTQGQALVDALATLDLLDFNDPAVLAEPYPAYARLRALPGIVPSETLGWLVAL